MRRIDGRWALLLGLAVTAQAPPQRTPTPPHFTIPHAFTPRLLRVPNNLLTNPGFETGNVDGGWYQCGSAPVYVTRQHPFRGRYDEYSGTRTGTGEPAGDSGVCQQVTIPANAVLTAHLYQLSDERDTAYAFQEADLLDNGGNVIVNLYRSSNHANAWIRGNWNLGAYAGRAGWLYFGVHGDGDPKHSTQQFVDEVTLGPRRE
ncbi:MAG TPA: hypothetical protein VGG51_06750 [Candidatus Cybelea sp.]|jgi:hypothetical protein